MAPAIWGLSYTFFLCPNVFFVFTSFPPLERIYYLILFMSLFTTFFACDSRRRSMVFATCVSRRISIGIVCVLISRASVAVARYAPVIILRYFPWIAWSFLITPFRAPWTPIGVYYTFAPYVIAGLIMDVYTRNAAVIDVPHVDPVIDFSAVSMLVTRESIAFSWACHFRVDRIDTILKYNFF